MTILAQNTTMYFLRERVRLTSPLCVNGSNRLQPSSVSYLRAQIFSLGSVVRGRSHPCLASIPEHAHNP